MENSRRSQHFPHLTGESKQAAFQTEPEVCYEVLEVSIAILGEIKLIKIVQVYKWLSFYKLGW